MPAAPLPFCPVPGCPVRSHGPCAVHRGDRARRLDAWRGSRHVRGYDSRWVRFVAVFRRALVTRGIVPACGTRLAPGPSPRSQCAAQGRRTFDDLQLDHDPPLEDWERRDPGRVCDPGRVAFLCAPCHTIATRRDQRLLT